MSTLQPAALQGPSARPAATRAFSLIEILVTVGLLSFIILGLLGMFTQTQRAFTSSMTQTDMLETGRGLMSIIAPEFEQMTPATLSTSTNFFVEIPSSTALPFAQVVGPNMDPLAMEMPGMNVDRTNVIQRCFMLSRLNQDWVGTGYEVLGDYANAGVGTLYRFYRTNYSRYGP